MTGAAEVGRGVLWPCIVANLQPQSQIILRSQGKKLVLDRLIVLAAFRLADLIKAAVHFPCTSKVLPVCSSFGTVYLVVLNLKEVGL